MNALLRDTKTTWTAEVEGFRVPLRKGLTLRIAPHTMVMASSANKGPAADAVWTVQEWSYKVESKTASHLEIIVAQVLPPRRWFKDPDYEFLVPFMLGFFTVLLPIFIGWVVYQSMGGNWWPLVGRYIRRTVGWTIFLLFAFILPGRLGLDRRGSFLGNYLTGILSVSGWILTFTWLGMTQYPEHFDWSNEQYASYGRDLLSRGRLSVWPLVLAALPWAAVAFKILGLETAEKTSDAVLKANKE